MEDLLDKTKKAVEKYGSKQSSDRLKASKAVLGAVSACRQFADENESESGSIVQRLAKEVSVILSAMPMFRQFSLDKKALVNIQDKKSAEDHFDTICNDLSSHIKNLEQDRKRKVYEWVRSHAVFGKLRKVSAKKLPEGAYVLLFRRSKDRQLKNEQNLAENNQEIIGLKAAFEARVPELAGEDHAGAGEHTSEMAECDAALGSTSLALRTSHETKPETLLLECESGSDSSGTGRMAVALLNVGAFSNEANDSGSYELHDDNTLNSDSALQSDEATCKESAELIPDPESDSESAPELDSDSSASSDTGPSTHSNIDTDTDTDIDTDTDSDTDTDTDSDTDSKTDSSLDLGAESGQSHAGQRQLRARRFQNEEDQSAQPTGTRAKPLSESRQAKPELVVRPSADGKVFTRFKLKEFADESRVYRMFKAGAPIIGACVIAGGKIEAAIGTLPQDESGDQLRAVLSVSKEAVSKPGKAFVESHEVLSELFHMSRGKEIDKDSYILLFEYVSSKEPAEKHSLDIESEHAEKAPLACGEAPGEAQGSALETCEDASEDSTEDPFTENDSVSVNADDGEAAPAAVQMEAAREEAARKEATGEQAAEKEAAEVAAGLAEGEASEEKEVQGDTDSTSASNSEPDQFDVQSQDEDDRDLTDESADSEKVPSELKLVIKKMEDGRIITRFRSFDFTDSRTLFEEYRKRNPLAGAAVIKGRQLIKAIGVLPNPQPGEKLIDMLLSYSRDAVEKPSMDFIEQNEVLKGLFDYAQQENNERDLEVVIFCDQEGKPVVMRLPDRRGYLQAKSPLFEFRSPKTIFERFKTVQIAGASVIGESGGSTGGREHFHGGKDRRPGQGSGPGQGRDRDRDRDRDKSRGPNRQIRRNSVVLKAFGRTPLRQNVVLSTEVLKRLGVDLSIL